MGALGAQSGCFSKAKGGDATPRRCLRDALKIMIRSPYEKPPFSLSYIRTVVCILLADLAYTHLSFGLAID
jgi:hypothetical protein